MIWTLFSNVCYMVVSSLDDLRFGRGWNSMIKSLQEKLSSFSYNILKKFYWKEKPYKICLKYLFEHKSHFSHTYYDPNMLETSSLEYIY